MRARVDEVTLRLNAVSMTDQSSPPRRQSRQRGGIFVEPEHLDVQNDEIGPVLLDERDRRGTVARLPDDLVDVLGEHLGQVDDEPSSSAITTADALTRRWACRSVATAIRVVTVVTAMRAEFALSGELRLALRLTAGLLVESSDGPLQGGVEADPDQTVMMLVVVGDRVQYRIDGNAHAAIRVTNRTSTSIDVTRSRCAGPASPPVRRLRSTTR